MTKLLPSQKMHMLADFISGVPDQNYEQSIWGTSGHLCGTVGCALGWGGIGLAQELGITYNPNDAQFTVTETGERIGGASSGYDAAQLAFGITYAEARELFGSRRVTRCEKVAELHAFADELDKKERSLLGKIKRMFET